MINFTKMHGAGNDYIYIDNRDNLIKSPAKLSVKISDRHYGVGSDGLILIQNSNKADFKMRIFNSDGSEAEMCGNGIRCFGKFVYDKKLIDNNIITVETLAGIMELKLRISKNRVKSAIVDMGEPILERNRIPMLGEIGMVVNEQLHLEDGANFEITTVSMGNPHAVIFVEDVEHFPLEKYGPLIENHNLFPNKINVEIVQIVSQDELIQRTWERGAGETLACGTGASAVAVAGVINKKANRKVKIHLRGGDLKIDWKEKDNHVYLDGEAIEIFSGQWEL